MKSTKIISGSILSFIVAIFLIGCSLTAPEIVNVTGVSIVEGEETDDPETVQLIAVVTPEDATNKAVSWESDDTDVVTVDENGLVSLVPGAETGESANITVTTDDGGFTDTIEVTVGDEADPAGWLPGPVVVPSPE